MSFHRVARIAALLFIVGCQSERAPSFTSSEQALSLMPAAQIAVTTELESGFGSPTNLVVWPMLPIDFGTYTATASSTDSGLLFDLKPASDFSFQSRIESLRGAAVQLANQGTDNQVLRVSAYNSSTKKLDLMDGTGGAATLAVKAGDTLSVVGDTLQMGRDLYLRHCMHCHGVSGDGDGPTGKYFAVKPRDYRSGKFKFTSTKSGVKATRDDLFRIIKLGVPGTYMPSFMLLPDDDAQALVEYIRWLAMRGEMEKSLVVELSLDFSATAVAKQGADEVRSQFDAYLKAELPGAVDSAVNLLKENWELAALEESAVLPKVARPATDAGSIERGRKHFFGKDANCISCHGETGRGNGGSTEAFNDIPGKPGQKSDKPGLFDDWGHIVKPRDLTSGIYRGGRRPIDIYRRISAGIKGTPMPGGSKILKDEEIWDITNYVLSIPFEQKAKKTGH